MVFHRILDFKIGPISIGLYVFLGANAIAESLFQNLTYLQVYFLPISFIFIRYIRKDNYKTRLNEIPGKTYLYNVFFFCFSKRDQPELEARQE